MSCSKEIFGNPDDAEVTTDSEQPVFDSPQGSKWVIGVDFRHNVFIVKKPNIHDSFFEGNTAEEIGLPPDLEDTEPGLYNIVCNLIEHRGCESGMIEDWNFEITSIEKI